MNAKNSDSMGITAENVKLDFSKAQAFKDGVVNKLTGGVGGLLKGNKVDMLKVKRISLTKTTFVL